MERMLVLTVIMLVWLDAMAVYVTAPLLISNFAGKRLPVTHRRVKITRVLISVLVAIEVLIATYFYRAGLPMGNVCLGAALGLDILFAARALAKHARASI